MRSPLKSIILILAAVFLGSAFFGQSAMATLDYRLDWFLRPDAI